MMETSAILKITKNAFYRSILILETILTTDTKLLQSKKLTRMAFGALSIGAKF